MNPAVFTKGLRRTSSCLERDASSNHMDQVLQVKNWTIFTIITQPTVGMDSTDTTLCLIGTWHVHTDQHLSMTGQLFGWMIQAKQAV
jgi:hypothetical protein